MRHVIAALCAVALIGCSATQATPTPGSTTAPGTVDVKGFAFSPTPLTVIKGSSVRYVNGDRAEHTVTQGSNGVADAGAGFDAKLAIDGSVSITFATAGEVHVTCRIHPTMNQVVTVTASGGAGGQPASAPAASAPATLAPTAAPAATPAAASPTPVAPSSHPPRATATAGPYGGGEYRP